MFSRLGAAIEELEVPVDGGALRALLALSDRLAAKVSAAIGLFDAGAGWAADAATSMPAWLRFFGGMTVGGAATTARTAAHLRRLPVTAEAWARGGLRSGQVQAIAANLCGETVGLFAEHEAEVVPALAPLPARDAAMVMRHWRARAEASPDRPAPAFPERVARLSRTLDGRWEMSGSFDEEGGALGDLARFFLDHQHAQRGGRNRPHLNVVVSLEAAMAGGSGRLVDGGYLDGASIARLLCDAGLHRVVVEGRSTILDYGATTYTAPNDLWNALVLRDQPCRHPGCDRPVGWCHAHHVIPFPHGPTAITNLVLKCSRHHHLAHQPGWRERLHLDGTLELTDPAGRTTTSVAPGLRDLSFPAA